MTVGYMVGRLRALPRSLVTRALGRAQTCAVRLECWAFLRVCWLYWSWHRRLTRHSERLRDAEQNARAPYMKLRW